MKDYKDLLVWQKSMELAKEIYRVCALLPKHEQFTLSDQMRRAVISIPSNIAEGFCRKSDKEFAYFLRVAYGSKAELETQLYLCREIGYLSADEISTSLSLCMEISKMLRSLLKKASDY